MSQTPQTDRLLSFWIAWSVVLLLILGFEGQRWFNPDTRAEALASWLCGIEADWLPFLPIFLSALVFWQIRGRQSGGRPGCNTERRDTTEPQHTPTRRTLFDTAISFFLGAVAISVTACLGWGMRDLPPAYHDEFSYLFQALTFLDGRTWFPSFEGLPQLFDQIHVLNEGRFASRYFPGAGIWFALFHSVGTIYGVWLAQGIVATGASIVAGEIAGRTARILTGLSVAFMPGLCLFSQLYLAHMPTLVGLMVFLVAIIRLRRCCDLNLSHAEGNAWGRLCAYGSSLLAGCGLSAAMLCRPMTAAGVGLPFGIWLFAWALRQWWRRRSLAVEAGHSSALSRSFSPAPLMVVVLMGLPILAGIGIELMYNRSITGSALRSPYQVYTDIYTPRHVYGFHNVDRGEQHLGPKVLDNYDRWAENLTFPLALKKMGIRVVASGRWTLGLVPLVFVVVLFLGSWRETPTDLKLIAASIVSLHLVHLPYWFEGIMGWHYVFETAPLWGIILGVVTARFYYRSIAAGHRALGWWWGGVLLISLCIQWLTIEPLWPGRLSRGMAELQFARGAYARFDEELKSRIHGRGIVFIRPNPSDRHIDYVYNTPRLDAEILRVRAPVTETELQQAISLFADRDPWLYDAANGTWTPLRPNQPAVIP